MRKLLTLFWDYKYLGVKFNYNNKFKKAQQLQFSLVNRAQQLQFSLVNRAQQLQFSLVNRAMFSLLRKCRQLNLPLDMQLELFEKCMYPILLYGFEIWACENMDVISKLQLRFLKLILKCQSYKPNMYGAWGNGKISDRN